MMRRAIRDINMAPRINRSVVVRLRYHFLIIHPMRRVGLCELVRSYGLNGGNRLSDVPDDTTHTSSYREIQDQTLTGRNIEDTIRVLGCAYASSRYHGSIADIEYLL
jgi:hypothetical protein